MPSAGPAQRARGHAGRGRPAGQGRPVPEAPLRTGDRCLAVPPVSPGSPPHCRRGRGLEPVEHALGDPARRLPERRRRARRVWSDFATTTIESGRLPFTSWFPYIGLGSAQYMRYQGLGSVLAGLVGTVFGPGTDFPLVDVPARVLLALCHLWLRPAVRPAPPGGPGRGAAVLVHGQPYRHRLRAGCLQLDRGGRGLDAAARLLDAALRLGRHVAGHEGRPLHVAGLGLGGPDGGPALRERLPRPAGRDHDHLGGAGAPTPPVGPRGVGVRRFSGWRRRGR